MGKSGWVDEFIAWHESVIAQYASAIQDELRRSRHLWLGGVAKRVRS